MNAVADITDPLMLPSLTNCPHVYVAIHGVMRDLAKVGIGKENENKEQGFHFRSIDQVFFVMTPILVDHQLLMLPRGISADQVTYETATKKTKFCTNVRFEYDFVSAVDGSRHTVSVFGEGSDMADKSTNKAMSGAYKYAAFLSFGIPMVGAIDDGDGGDPGDPVVGGGQRASGQPPAPAQPPPERFQGTRRETAKQAGVENTISDKRKAELRIIGNSFVDLVEQERIDVSVNNHYKIWEMVEVLKHDELLWLSVYLDKKTRVLTRLRAIMTEEREKQAAARAANDPQERMPTMPDNF